MRTKPQMRVLGIDDAPFDRSRKGARVRLVGVVVRGADYLDGILSTSVTVDGRNATARIATMVNGSKWKRQLQAIFLDGIAVAGFNVIDIRRLHAETGIPVVVVMRRQPDIAAIRRALERSGMPERMRVIGRAPQPEKVGDIYVQAIGTEREEMRRVLRICCAHAKVPEALRLAHIIASGVTDGESRGRA
ncbi:DUF99 family protein [Candidatus Woesearchaeota archaeon]|nr:DUF99 family protein [Candidatus Woesearchaeota archaeon]